MSDTQPKLAIRTTSKALTTEYDVMFDRDIDNSSEFHEEFYTMRQAGEGDIVNIHMDSMGGACSTISTFEHIKSKSSAHFHGILQGKAFSAGSAIFLLCDTYEVGSLAEMMIHTSQQGMRGHSQEVEEWGKQSARGARIMMELVYKDFLTQEEIDRCLDGKAMWLDSNQIKERLANRETIRNLQAVAEAKETYTPEVYASACVQDILEDCIGFEYDPIGIIESMLEEVKASVEEELSITKAPQEPNVHFDGSVVFFGETGFNVQEATRDDLVWIAGQLGIVHAWNISEEKLRKRILDFFTEE